MAAPTCMAFRNALEKAYAEAAEGVLERIATRMAATHVAMPRDRGERVDRPPMRSRIAGTGSYLPSQVLTNHELARRVDTSDAWIRAAHRHPRAPDRRAGRDDQRPRAARRAGGAGCRRASRRRTSI